MARLFESRSRQTCSARAESRRFLQGFVNLHVQVRPGGSCDVVVQKKRAIDANVLETFACECFLL
jgi:hypothetical protein